MTPSFTEIKSRIISEDTLGLGKIRFNSKAYGDLIPILLSCSILEQCSAICELGEIGYELEAENLLRGVIEKFISLKLVNRSKEYLFGYLLNDAKNEMKTLDRAKKGNQFFAGIGGIPNLEELIADNRSRIEELEDSSPKWGTIKSRFEDANEVELYEGLYHKLCESVHGSLAALTKRHIKVEVGQITVGVFGSVKKRETEAMRGSLVELLDAVKGELDHYTKSRSK